MGTGPWSCLWRRSRRSAPPGFTCLTCRSLRATRLIYLENTFKRCFKNHLPVARAIPDPGNRRSSDNPTLGEAVCAPPSFTLPLLAVGNTASAQTLSSSGKTSSLDATCSITFTARRLFFVANPKSDHAFEKVRLSHPSVLVGWEGRGPSWGRALRLPAKQLPQRFLRDSDEPSSGMDL